MIGMISGIKQTGRNIAQDRKKTDIEKEEPPVVE